jgi:hypothetical protein
MAVNLNEGHEQLFFILKFSYWSPSQAVSRRLAERLRRCQFDLGRLVTLSLLPAQSEEQVQLFV